MTISNGIKTGPSSTLSQVMWVHFSNTAFYQVLTVAFQQECMIGIAFSDESEASALNKKVLNRKKYAGAQ